MAQKTKIIALDIGSHSAKVAVASVGGESVAISRTESFRIPAGEHVTMETIRPWMEKNGFLNSRAVIALAGKDVIFQPFQLVPADPRTPEQAAAMEVLKFNEMASESMVYDYSEFSLGKEDRRLLLSIARPSLLAGPLAMASAGNIQVEDIVPAPIAVFNGLVDEYGAEGKCAVYINAGHTSTSLGIGIGSQLVFARAFSCGGEIFTSAIAESTGVPTAQAENAKHASGSLKEGTPHAEALAPAADRWFAEMNSCLAIFKSLFPSDKSKIDEVILTGGAAKLDGLPEFLGEKIGCKVIVPDGDGSSDTKEMPAEYAVCKGLAHSLTNNVRSNISLLPEDIRDDIASRRQRPFWIASTAVAVIILAVSLVSGYVQLKRTQGVLNNRQVDMTARRQLASQIKSIRMKNDRIKHMGVPLTSLLRSTPVMATVLKTVAENRGADEWITVVCDSESYFNLKMYEEGMDPYAGDRAARTKEEEEQQQAGITSVIIEGFTRNTSLSTVSSLITELGKLEFVESADLLSDDMLATLPQENLEEQLRAIRFAIEVKVVDK